jgi:hypothetical protein
VRPRLARLNRSAHLLEQGALGRQPLTLEVAQDDLRGDVGRVDQLVLGPPRVNGVMLISSASAEKVSQTISPRCAPSSV